MDGRGNDNISADLKRVLRASNPQACLKAISEQFGIDFVTYHLAYQDIASVDLPYVRTNFPDDWVGRYVLMNYGEIDPVSVAGFSYTEPFLWSDLDWTGPTVQTFLKDAAAHGIGPSGFMVPIVDKRRRRASVSYCSSMEQQAWSEFLGQHREALISAAHILHDKAMVELGEAESEAPPLTPRELQCLGMAADGRDARDMAEKMGISEHTVRDYLKSARWKLGCSNIAQAVHKATRLRLIDFE